MMSTVAARAALAVVLLAAVAVLARRRVRRAPAPAPVSIVARTPLAPGLGIAVVEAGGRRLLVGWGKDGVRLVRDLGVAEGRP